MLNKEITSLELFDVLNKSEFYQAIFDIYNNNHITNSFSVRYDNSIFNQKCYFDTENLRTFSENEAIDIINTAEKIILIGDPWTIYDEAFYRLGILAQCLKQQHVEIMIEDHNYQKLDMGLWMIDADMDNIIKSINVYHDLFDFSKFVKLA